MSTLISFVCKEYAVRIAHISPLIRCFELHTDTTELASTHKSMSLKTLQLELGIWTAESMLRSAWFYHIDLDACRNMQHILRDGSSHGEVSL
jgi:hypothetical protein